MHNSMPIQFCFTIFEVMITEKNERNNACFPAKNLLQLLNQSNKL